MSTFGGLMKEYRLISLDRFDGINLNSTVYMLSHNHSGKNIGAAVFLGYSEKGVPQFSNVPAKISCFGL